VAALRPDVLVKGGDWASDQIIGREEVEAAGGRVVSVPVVAGYSTSAMVEKIRKLSGTER
jgi:D-glycero-beta-D-manno-heptose 1-phosphate adenylyltransferase